MLNNQDRIDAYLRNEMSESERRAFEQDLKSNPSLYQDFTLTKAISTALAERQNLRSKMNQWELEARLKEKVSLQKRWTYGISAAAAIAVIIFAVSPMFFVRTTRSGSDFAMPTFEQSSISNTTDDIARIDSLIESKNYIGAFESVDNLLEEYNDSLKSIKTDSPASSAEQLQIAVIENNIYILNWRRINLLLALDRKNEAVEALKEFMRQDGEYKQEALNLYDSLK